jgi:MFS family permease
MLNEFKKLMSARFLFTLGTQMQAVIIGWQIYELTRDPLALGIVGLAEAVPALGLALYAGYVVDRSKPVKVYAYVLAGSLLSGLVLLASQLMGDHLTVANQVAALYISSVITGAARSFAQPAIFATVPKIVKREDLSTASAWMSTAMQIARIAGPAVGGMVFGWLGMTVSAEMVCIILAMSIFSLVLIKNSPPAPAVPAQRAPMRMTMREELWSGVSFVFAHPILLPALSLDMISVLFGGVTALLPIYAKEILFIGPKGLGVLRAAPAIGATVTSLLLTRINLRARAGSWLFAAVTGFGVCVLVFGVSQSFALSVIALGLSGAFDSVSMVVRTAAVQLASPDHMRGRISAVNSIFIGSSNELGEFESGVMAKFMGTVNSVIFGGVMCLLTVFSVAVLSPRLRKLDLDRVS